MPDTPRSITICTKLQRIAALAKERPGEALTTLAHHIDIEWLQEAFRRTRKDAAPGVDGLAGRDFEQDLDRNLSDLLGHAKAGTYRAPPVRRVDIPKGNGRETRPIGIPTFADKVLQRSIAMVLEAVYEQEFVDSSFGFRPGRSAHQALDCLWKHLMDMGGGWVLEIDIRRFFDTLVHEHLRAFLRQRVRDGVILRLIDKWLKAGVMHGGAFSRSDKGTPQGGVVSPILANVYLHNVLDTWFEQTVKPRLRGQAHLVRYADDATLVFQSEADARRVLEVLPKRFGRFGLTLHPEKTRLVDFRRPDRRPYQDEPTTQRTRSFDLLGFTHIWARSRQGRPVIKRKTSKTRFSRALRAVSTWCRHNRHLPIPEQQRILCQKLVGHYAYFGITGNWRALARLHHQVKRIWHKWLSRRSQRGYLRWDVFHDLLGRYPLPPARAIHSTYRP